MITHAPDWLQPFLWIGYIALAAISIVFIWSKLSTLVERLHVEGMSKPPRHWKNKVLIVLLLLSAAAITIVVNQIV